MGARAQVKIQDTGVFLYTHWGSGEIVDDVRTAIRQGKRLDDPEYLARIIFDRMKRFSKSSETGFGIGTGQHGDIDILVSVDCSSQRVTLTEIYEGRSEVFSFKEFASG